MRNFKFLLLVFFLSNFIYSQQTVVRSLNGKITSDYPDLEGIYIANLKTDVATVSEKNGYFSINASVGDTLLFSAVQFVGIKIKLKEQDFTNSIFFVRLETMTNELDEVKIQQYKNINSVSLGLVSKNQKKYTPAERKLKAAGELHWYSPLLIPLGGMSVDGLLNAISGRTAQLKQELVVERKELLLLKIATVFQENYFTETLKIPAENVKGFQYYIVDDENFIKALNSKNRTMASFLMAELAVKYKELIKPE